jgi:hypothetical protein
MSFIVDGEGSYGKHSGDSERLHRRSARVTPVDVKAAWTACHQLAVLNGTIERVSRTRSVFPFATALLTARGTKKKDQ